MEGLLFKIADIEIFVHQSIVIWLVLCVLVSYFFYWGGKKFKNADSSVAPNGAVLLLEILVNTAKGIIGGNLKQKTWDYLPFFGTLMLMMVLSNLMGVVGLQPPTSNLSVTVTLAMIMIILIHATDIKNHGIVAKIKGYFEPVSFLFPLNVVGDLAFPFSLTLRLFGNMLGGSIIMGLLYVLIGYLLPFSLVSLFVTPFLHMYFDMFGAFMQTFIFFTIASFFLGQNSDV